MNLLHLLTATLRSRFHKKNKKTDYVVTAQHVHLFRKQNHVMN